ncbi:hypothetical protein PMAYCL1PPCAC_22044, partial [Pristionchus mayeri]
CLIVDEYARERGKISLEAMLNIRCTEWYSVFHIAVCIPKRLWKLFCLRLKLRQDPFRVQRKIEFYRDWNLPSMNLVGFQSLVEYNVWCIAE